MKVKFILDFQKYKVGDTDQLPKKDAERLMYRGIAVEMKGKDSNESRKIK